LKADLHVHSRHSKRAPEWLFRRAGLPDSYTAPRELYDQLRGAGMDLVTITDHNSIDGCLEIAHLPGVVIGEQVTTRFPEDRCEVHLLVWGLDEAQHAAIQAIREEYLRSAKVSRWRRSAARRGASAVSRWTTASPSRMWKSSYCFSSTSKGSTASAPRC
jgi:predicted metal-dependent phosphoesterase TrpH